MPRLVPVKAALVRILQNLVMDLIYPVYVPDIQTLNAVFLREFMSASRI